MKTLKNISIVVLITSLLVLSCETDDQLPKPVAEFSASKTSVTTDEIVYFTNQSENGKTYLWNFGDGEKSDLESPSHKFTSAGVFLVKLEVSNGNESVEKSLTISVEKLEPVADFSISSPEAGVNEAVRFTNHSENATSYEWDFGDGSTSTASNPVHYYASTGTYTVTLTAYRNEDSNSATKEVNIMVPENILPGQGAMNINLDESWKTVKSKLGDDYTQYGPLLITGNGGSIIIHPVESAEKGVMLYILSLSGSFELNSSDVVFMISLKENFVGSTEKGIMMGSTLTEVKNAFGTPEEHDTKYDAYKYESLGINFYYNSGSKIEEMMIYPADGLKSSKNTHYIMEEIERTVL